MNQERLMNIILAPHVTEKTAMSADASRQFAFKVDSTATKHEIKAAVELAFEVKVAAVQVLNVKGKTKRFGQVMGRRKDWKKAYVTLQEGFDINFAEAQA